MLEKYYLEAQNIYFRHLRHVNVDGNTAEGDLSENNHNDSGSDA